MRRPRQGTSRTLLELARTGGGATAFRVVGSGLSFLLTVTLGRLLGADALGVYFLALTTMNLTSLAARLGVEKAVLRHMSAAVGHGDTADAAGIERNSISIVTISSIVFTVLLIFTAPLLASDVFGEPDLLVPMRVMAIAILPFNLLLLFAELIRSVYRAATSMLVQSIMVPAVAIVIVLVTPDISPTTAAAAYLVGTLGAFGAGALLWHRARPWRGKVAGRLKYKTLAITGLPLAVVAATNFILTWTDTAMLGIWTSSDAVGVYGVVVRLSMLVSLILVGVNAIAAPKFASHYARSELDKVVEVAHSAVTITAVCAGPVVLALCLFPATALAIFGTEFVAGDRALQVLALAQLLIVVTGPAGQLLMMTGHERMLMHANLAAAGTNIALNAILIPVYGIEGAAIATATSLALLNVALTLLAYRLVNVLVIPLPGYKRP